MGVTLLACLVTLHSCAAFSSPPIRRYQHASVITRMVGTSKNDASAVGIQNPLPPQYTGHRLENGTWVDAIGARNGPPVNFWKSSQLDRLIAAQADLLYSIDQCNIDDVMNKLTWFEERNGQRKIATSPKVEGDWLLRGVFNQKESLMLGDNILQICQLLPVEVGDGDEIDLEANKRLQPGVRYAQRTGVPVKAADGSQQLEWVNGFHCPNSEDQNVREYGFDNNDSILASLSSLLGSVRCTYLDHGLRIERNDDESQVFVYTKVL